MSCCNIIDLPPVETKNGENSDIVEHIKYLPDSIRKEVRLLCKQYYILSVEQCGSDRSFTVYGNLISLNIDKVMYMDQMYNIKIEYMNTDTKQRFFKVFKSY